jgi:hypothetical protein
MTVNRDPGKEGHTRGPPLRMLSAVSVPSTAPARHARPRPSWTVRLTVLGLVLVGVGVVGLTGGLRTAPAPPPTPLPTLAVNDVIDAGPWKLSVTNAAAVTDLGAYKPRKEGDWLLAVAVRIEVTGPDSESGAMLGNVATLPDFADLVDAEPMAVALVRDGSRLEFIHPGLPERVAFIFEVRAGTPVPASVVVVLRGWTAEKSWTTRRWEWRNEGERARVTVPITNRMANP